MTAALAQVAKLAPLLAIQRGEGEMPQAGSLDSVEPLLALLEPSNPAVLPERRAWLLQRAPPVMS